MKKWLPLVCVLALGAACSRSSDPPAGEPAKPGVSPAEASAPAAAAAEPLPEDLQARLVRAESPVMGPANAPVTIVEFLDPACEACRAFAPVVKQIQFLYPEQVRVVARFADFHPGSDEAIRLLLAAQQQGKFEPVLAALFEGQEKWASHHAPNVDEAWKLAVAAGLNESWARKDATAAKITGRLAEESEDIVALQVNRTPTFYVNGKLLTDFGVEQLMALVAAEVKASDVSGSN
jgi:protein-disulfide isomerase